MHTILKCWKVILLDRNNIFEKYIIDMYKIKEKSDRGSPMYLISKLLMNSLYGRFGMNPVQRVHEVIEDKDLEGFIMK